MIHVCCLTVVFISQKTMAAKITSTTTAGTLTAGTVTSAPRQPVSSTLRVLGDAYEGKEAKKSRVARTKFSSGIQNDPKQQFCEVVSSKRCIF